MSVNVGSLKYSVEGKNRKSVGLQEIASYLYALPISYINVVLLYQCCLIHPRKRTCLQMNLGISATHILITWFLKHFKLKKIVFLLLQKKVQFLVLIIITVNRHSCRYGQMWKLACLCCHQQLMSFSWVCFLT